MRITKPSLSFPIPLLSHKTMGTCNLNLVLVSLHLLFFTLFACNPIVTSSELNINPLDDACKDVNCWQGTCRPLFIGFDCDCFPGWNKIQIGPLTFPACAIPNCTVDFTCGNGAPPPPPPPVAPPPPLNLTSPCFLTWCGDGTCMANGTNHVCQCNEGSANLFNVPAFACFKQCSFGADCHSLGLGPPSPPPSPPSTSGSSPPLSPPSTSGSGSNGTGSEKVPNSSRNLGALTSAIIAATLLISL